MLGLGQSLSHGGAPSETPFKLVISNVKLLPKSNDAFFCIRARLSADTRTEVGTATTGAYSRYTGLTADVTLNRVNTDTEAVISTATATLNVYKPGASSNNIFLSDATGSSSQAALTGSEGADTLDMADTGVFSSDISTSIEAQAFRVDVILKGTGFEDSDSSSSEAEGTAIAISA